MTASELSSAIGAFDVPCENLNLNEIIVDGFSALKIIQTLLTIKRLLITRCRRKVITHWQFLI